MELNSQYIGSFIKFMRKKAGLTQYELAERIGVGSKTISKWEQGRGIPDISFLYSLSLELDVDIESLLAGNLDDIGKEWIGVICVDDTTEGEILGWRQWECMISMFLLVGIREIAVLCTNRRMVRPDAFLNEYQKKGFFRKVWCVSSDVELIDRVRMEKRHICWLYQPAFLYGMHLTRYMRRAMVSGKTTVLALRQGKDSFMPGMCFNDEFVCSSLGESVEHEWHMFPMIFGQGEKIIGYMEQIEKSQGEFDNVTSIFEYFSPMCVEAMERGMLAFPFQTIKERELAEKIILGIEGSQHIRIGNLEEIMQVRGWK